MKEKLIEFDPAFDKRDPVPSKNYGIHGVEIRFILRGDAGAVHFLLFTNWQLPHVTKEFEQKTLRDDMDLKVLWQPMPAEIGYHNSTPQYEGHEPTRDKCPHLGGKPCYYSSTCLPAIPVFQRLLREGADGVWTALEHEYLRAFGKEAA